MTVSICITHEGTSGTFSRLNFENQWSYLFEIIVPDKIYIKNAIIEDGECSWINDPIFTTVPYSLITDYSEITESITYLTSENSTLMPGEINLKDYVHPVSNVCYAFGANDSNLVSDVIGDKVYIETSNDWQYYNWNVASILFYDRRVKNGAS